MKPMITVQRKLSMFQPPHDCWKRQIALVLERKEAPSGVELRPFFEKVALFVVVFLPEKGPLHYSGDQSFSFRRMS
jgi:hypothetical protein